MAAAKGSEERFAGAMESLVLLAESMQQASALLADADDGDDSSEAQSASFLNIVALGSVVRSAPHLPLTIPKFLRNSQTKFCAVDVPRGHNPNWPSGDVSRSDGAFLGLLLTAFVLCVCLCVV